VAHHSRQLLADPPRSLTRYSVPEAAAGGLVLSGTLLAFLDGPVWLVPAMIASVIAVSIVVLRARHKIATDVRNFSDVVVLWTESGPPEALLAELRAAEEQLDDRPETLERWWDVVIRAAAEQSGAPRVLPSPVSTSPRPTGDDTDHETWALARKRHERVAESWTDLVCDPLAALTHCALFDVTHHYTAAFIEALGRADDFISIHGPAFPRDRADVDTYAALARTLENTWQAARTQAERSGLDWLPASQRADAERARRLLTLASDDGASLAERANAAERAATLLRRIHAVVLPDTTMHALESLSRPELT
jgi:hypothetical protein